MSSLNFAHFPLGRRLFYCALLALTALYPGHNALQTLTLTPGEVLSYSFPHPSLSPYPAPDGTAPPSLTARAVVIQDVGSKALLFSASPDTPLYPASTTKIMTALVALAHYDPDQILVITSADLSTGQTMGLVAEEAVTVQALLTGLLVGSANDAAVTLANHYEGGYPAFMAAMNARAATLHLGSTTFTNPVGFDSSKHVTTARDLAVLAAHAMSQPAISRLTATPAAAVTDITGNITHRLTATNELVGKLDGVLGLKTGWTAGAGECLVTYVERDGHPVIVVLLGSLDRFGETRALVDWVYSHHTWVVPE